MNVIFDCERCGRTVVNICYCNWVESSVAVMPTKPVDVFLESYHALWAELHSQDNVTREWFSGWVSRVPQFGCGCQSWLNDYVAANPPRFDDFKRWAWEMHNAVNEKLGKPFFEWEQLNSIPCPHG